MIDTTNCTVIDLLQFLIFRKLYVLQFKEITQKVLEQYQLDLGVFTSY